MTDRDGRRREAFGGARTGGRKNNTRKADSTPPGPTRRRADRRRQLVLAVSLFQPASSEKGYFMNEGHSEDDPDFSGMSDDELTDIVKSRFGDYPQTVVDGAKNELKKREDDAAGAGSGRQVTTGEPPPPVPLTDESGGKLYTLGQIALATLLGAPIAGSLILARNHQALGKSSSAWREVVLGGAATIFLVSLAFILPENFPTAGFAVGSCVGMYYYAKGSQGDAIENHLKAGGGKGSWAVTVLLGIICSVILLGLLFALLATLDLLTSPD